jgi:hypothetical protein
MPRSRLAARPVGPSPSARPAVLPVPGLGDTGRPPLPARRRTPHIPGARPPVGQSVPPGRWHRSLRLHKGSRLRPRRAGRPEAGLHQAPAIRTVWIPAVACGGFRHAPIAAILAAPAHPIGAGLSVRPSKLAAPLSEGAHQATVGEHKYLPITWLNLFIRGAKPPDSRGDYILTYTKHRTPSSPYRLTVCDKPGRCMGAWLEARRFPRVGGRHTRAHHDRRNWY